MQIYGATYEVIQFNFSLNLGEFNYFVLCDGDGDVVDGQASFLEKIFAHVGQRRCRIDGVAADAVLLKVRRRVASLIINKIK